ncbi:MAG: glycoside hydrolase family 2 protein, partial [Dysgonamonadaceae bacterium]|nr:glycoside hydrolase family 2 protein [Dysgonamonadaceae bacterium]
WKFRNQLLTDAPAAIEYNDGDWTTVNIPHTWNSADAQDGGGDYLRTVGWYRKTFAWNNEWQDKKLYLELLGACLQAECFVNGESVGVHKGGYTAFRFDITPQLTNGNNVIAIKVDNRLSEEIAPLSGDFSFMGGIYRNIFLIVAEQEHIDLLDNGSSGLYLSPSQVSETAADLEIKATIVNRSSLPKTLTIEGALRNPDRFEAIAALPNPVFSENTMYSDGETLRSVSRTVIIQPDDSYRFTETLHVANPRLWNGKADPYRYRVDLKVRENGKVRDSISEYVGFRYFSVTKDGFFLNGNRYPLRGVNRHQDRYNKGTALTRNEHDEDFGMIYDMGANAIRLAHYPHDPYFYDLCDRYGLVVWTELPLVDRPGTAATFDEVTKQQLRELIRQQYNRPSIFFWGLQNEVKAQYDARMLVLMPELNRLAHAEDAARLTVQATNHTTARGWDSDLFAWNYYPGWYADSTSFRSKLTSFKNDEIRPTAISEYGAGGSIFHHETNPAKPVTNRGAFHPEEYQAKVHEQALADFSTCDFVWGAFLWNMFDFASDSRSEGDRAGINDKGIVTYDRQVKKDSYFAYKANWSNSPVLYIASRRFTERTEPVTPVVVYSNCDSVELFVNTVSKGIKRFAEVQSGCFRWNDIELAEGKNQIRVVAMKNQTEYSDEIVWNLETTTYCLIQY